MADPILCLSGISAAPGAKSGRVRDEKESADLKGFKMLTFGCIALLMYDFSHVWLAGVAMGSASLALANTVMEVAVERDWCVYPLNTPSGCTHSRPDSAA
jgi:hypothetical protein